MVVEVVAVTVVRCFLSEWVGRSTRAVGLAARVAESMVAVLFVKVEGVWLVAGGAGGREPDEAVVEEEEELSSVRSSCEGEEEEMAEV